MIQTNATRAAAIALVAGMAAIPSAVMSRTVSVDSLNFDQTGIQWTGDFVDIRNDGHFQGSLPFQLNFGDGAKNYNFSFSENGFVQFFAAGSAATSTSSPTGNYIAPFAADLAFGLSHAQLTGTSYASGLIDPTAPYNLDEAVNKAFRFTWLGMCPASDVDCEHPDTFQIVLFDQGAGDFRIQFNYGLSFGPGDVFGDPTSLAGQQGYSLGGNTLALHTGPFNSNNPDYCFTGGVGSLCGSVVAVPEPETYAMLALGLATVGGWSKRRRRAAVVSA